MTMVRCLLFVALLCSASVARAELFVIEFTKATGCIYCDRMVPVREQLTKEGYKIVVVNVDKDERYTRLFNINAFPTFLVVDARESQGQRYTRVLGRSVGAQSAWQLRQFFKDNGVKPKQ